jgi:predicted ATPase/Tfp pilus assembly protein PilF
VSKSGLVVWNETADYWLDITQFEYLCQQPAHLAEAIALYTGDLASDLYEDWLETERERLRDLYLVTLEELIDQQRRRGDYAAAVVYAQQLLAADPLREESVRLLMQLRYESGDRAGAIQTYQEFEQYVQAELEVPPLPETADLYEQIWREESSIKREEQPLPMPPSPPLHNLPAPVTSFVGRKNDRATIINRLVHNHSRLLTITGPGGSGKTRLALEIGRQFVMDGAFVDGVYFVDLTAVTDPTLLCQTITTTLNIEPDTQQSATNQLKQYLQSKHLLLILDNCEQIVAGSSIIGDLLTATPKLQILATSRILLQIYGEQEYPLAPLPVPDLNKLPDPEGMLAFAAVSLFVDRARAFQPAFALTADNTVTIAQICHQLDGIPLAIELAAARIKLFPPQKLLAKLSQRLQFLASQMRDLPTRQRTLRHTIDWSFDLLSEPLQKLFMRLGVFAGSFTLAAAEAVMADTAVMDGLIELVDQSMVETADSPQQPRFRLLFVLREYALEKLNASTEQATYCQHHAQYYLTFAEEAEQGLLGSQQVDWLTRLDQDHDNLRAALDWAVRHDSELALRLGNALYRFWQIRGHISEARRWFEQILTIQPDHPTADLAQGWQNAGYLASRQSDYPAAEQAYAQSMIQLQSLNDQASKAKLLLLVSRLRAQTGDWQTALRYIEESLSIFETLEDFAGQYQALMRLGVVTLQATDYNASRQYFAAALHLQRQIDDKAGLSDALNNLGWVEYALGNYQTAHDLHLENLALRQQLGFTGRLPQTLHNLGLALVKLGDIAQAIAYTQQSIQQGQQLGLKMSIVEGLETMAMACASSHRAAEATRLLAAAQSWRKQLGSTHEDVQLQDINWTLSHIHASLSDEAFEEAWGNGRSLTFEQAIDYAQTISSH